VYVKCSLAECEKRDPKGLYQKARNGVIPQFTGISAPYEEPFAAELLVETDKHTIDECVSKVVQYLKDQLIIK
jgi:adenylylsulfate kinase